MPISAIGDMEEESWRWTVYLERCMCELKVGYNEDKQNSHSYFFKNTTNILMKVLIIKF